MLNKRDSKFLLVLLAVMMLFVVSCGKEKAEVVENFDEELTSGSLVVWSFTDEAKQMVEYFSDIYPDIDIEFVIIPHQDEAYLNKLVSTMRSGSEVPDVFTGEVGFFRQVIDSGFWEPISDAPYNAEELVKDQVPYLADLSRDADGKINCLSWQATPGAMYYRRSIAKAVLGTDDPEEVSKWTSSIDSYYELGEKIKAQFGGEKFLVAGARDMFQFVSADREQPYVVDGTLTIPKSFVDFMKLTKDIRDNKLEAGHSPWSPGWYSAAASGDVFSYILPTWGLHYVLKPSTEPEAFNGEKEFTGDWGLCVPPTPYSSGGTFVGINRNSKKKQLAWQLVKFMGANEEFLTSWAKQTGDFVSNLNVVRAIKDDFSEPFLGGQNHYEYFYEQSKNVRGDHIGPWDTQIQNAWEDQVELYANSEKSLDEAIADFKQQMTDILPDVKVVVKQ